MIVLITGNMKKMKRKRALELQELDKQCWRTIGKGYKDSSKANIQCQFNNYTRFCNYFFLKQFPADSWQLVRCAQYLANEGKSPGTIANTISTIRTLQGLMGWPTPELYDIAIKLELKGLNNLSQAVVKRANPMTPEILLKISQKVDVNNQLEMVCFVAILVGFFLLLRKSNLIPDNLTGKKAFDANKQFQRKDLRIGDKTILADQD